MTELKLTKDLEKEFPPGAFAREISIYGGHYDGHQVLVFSKPVEKMLKFYNGLYESCCIKDCCDPDSIIQIAGNNNELLLLKRNGKLFKYAADTLNSAQKCLRYKWVPYNDVNFINILALTDYGKGFACLWVTESGRKQLSVFETKCLPSFEDYTFQELNANDSKDYYLKNAVGGFSKCSSLIVSDNFSGNTYLCSGNGQSSLIYCSRNQLISTIAIASEDCLLLWFKNGKIVFHYFSQLCSNKVLFLNERVKCVEKCICNDKCFLWSDGIILHHTEMNLSEGKPKMTNFKLQNNVVGVINLINTTDFVLAQTINGNIYELYASSKKRKELTQSNAEVFSQIYNESLKLTDIQENIEDVSLYLKFKEAVQNNRANVELKYEEWFLNIKNVTDMTFKRQTWRIDIESCDRGRTLVKIVELEADLVSGMMMRVKNPFDSFKKIKVYLTGQFKSDLLSFCIGIIKNDEEETGLNVIKGVKVQNQPQHL